MLSNILAISDVIKQSLTIFGQGMIAILIVIMLIFLTTVIMTSVSGKIEAKKAAKEMQSPPPDSSND